jgi:hypothetical protein
MVMTHRWLVGGVSAFVCVILCGLVFRSATARDTDSVSYKNDVVPIFKKYCLPCHASDSNNPSELFMDSYADLMKGGEHGAPVVPGDPVKSLLLRKLEKEPPFGDPMPLNKKRRKSQTPPVRLTDEEVKVLQSWIEQGAKEN